MFVAGIGEQDAVAQVSIPLPPRRVTFHAAEAATDLKLPRPGIEQAAGVVSDCGRRRGGRGRRRLLTGHRRRRQQS
jgi:hypothetical protein